MKLCARVACVGAYARSVARADSPQHTCTYVGVEGMTQNIDWNQIFPRYSCGEILANLCVIALASAMVRYSAEIGFVGPLTVIVFFAVFAAAADGSRYRRSIKT